LLDQTSFGGTFTDAVSGSMIFNTQRGAGTAPMVASAGSRQPVWEQENGPESSGRIWSRSGTGPVKGDIPRLRHFDGSGVPPRVVAARH